MAEEKDKGAATANEVSPAAARGLYNVSGVDIPRSMLPTLATVIAAGAILYLGQQVFLPLAVALLLTFALAPLVSFLRRRSVPRLPAVILVVGSAFLAIAFFSMVIVAQVNTLAQNLPAYQTNILEKVRTLKDMGASGGIIDRLSGAVQQVGAELERNTATLDNTKPKLDPVPVEIVSHDNPVQALYGVIGPLISPFATTGLIIVVVIFMLLEREDLRDRFIRLVGYHDLHRTTQALEDAGKRVGRYLLMQLVVNITYAVPIAAGLWWLGIPNALLWGMLILVLRFVPYIGPAIGMMLPLFLAVAVDPGWSLVAWTAALFLTVELISNNVIEPWLYGTRTGLSPLAVIVSAIFWAWLWGPLGLVLSTPLTVCLVVLGRHVPQFAFLDVLLGNEPVLEPHTRIYQRLLAGDPDEATDHAELFLENDYLIDFYDQVALPALQLAEQDRLRGVMSESERGRLAESTMTLVANLEAIAAEEAEEEEEDSEDETAASDDENTGRELPSGEGRSLLCIGGRSEIDDAASAMLAQVLKVQGADALSADHSMLEPNAIRKLPLDTVDTAVVTLLNPNSINHARHIVRRLKRVRPTLRIGLLVPGFEGDAKLPAEKLERMLAATHADFLAQDMDRTVRRSFEDKPAQPLRLAPIRIARRRAARSDDPKPLAAAR